MGVDVGKRFCLLAFIVVQLTTVAVSKKSQTKDFGFIIKLKVSASDRTEKMVKMFAAGVYSRADSQRFRRWRCFL